MAKVGGADGNINFAASLGGGDEKPKVGGADGNVNFAAGMGDGISRTPVAYTTSEDVLWALDALDKEPNKHTCEAHNHQISAMELMGDWLICGSWDQSITVWDLKPIQQNKDAILHHTHMVTGVVLSLAATDANIFLCLGDRDIVVIDWTDWETKDPLKGHKRAVNTLHMDEGWKLYSAANDFTIKVWDANAMALIETYTENNDGVSCITVSHSMVGCASWHEAVEVWRVQPNVNNAFCGFGDTMDKMTGVKKPANKLTCETAFVGMEPVTALLALNTKTMLATTTSGHIHVFDLITNKLVFSAKSTMFGHEEAVTAIAFSGDYICTGAKDNLIKVVKAPKKTEAKEEVKKPAKR